MSATMEKFTWDPTRILRSNLETVGLVTPYHLPKTINVLISSNKQLLLGAIGIESLHSKSAPSCFSGAMIVFQMTEFGKPQLIVKQRIEVKANRPDLKKEFIELSTPIVMQPKCEYKLRFVFDSSWTPRNFYCLNKIVKCDSVIDGETTINISPEKK